MAGKYLLTTLGCKVNQYESQQIREALHRIGLQPAQAGETADVAIVNTCAVTCGAARKNRQAIRRAASGGQTAVVVVGCGATADGADLRTIRGVEAVFSHGTNVPRELGKRVLTLLERRRSMPPRAHPNGRSSKTPSHTTTDESGATAAGGVRPAMIHPPPGNGSLPPIIPGSLQPVKRDQQLTTRIAGFAGHHRAFLKIQDGCDAHCTYCIIPRLRSRLRSKPVAVALEEARDLVHAGFREIVLTGIFLGAYGRDTVIRKRFTTLRSPLADLVRALTGIEGLERLRLSSLEPGDVNGELLDVLAGSRRCVPHLHLPLQSGSSEILRRMNRQYTRDAFLRMIDNVRFALDRPAITTDIIVGFPGESNGDFQASVDIAQATQFCKIHAFPFSPRPGTAAARWQRAFVAPSLVRDRMNQLAEVDSTGSIGFRRQFVGDVERLIVERVVDRRDGADSGETAAGPRRLYRGRAGRYFEIHFEGPEHLRPGDVVNVRINRVTPNRTHGTAL